MGRRFHDRMIFQWGWLLALSFSATSTLSFAAEYQNSVKIPCGDSPLPKCADHLPGLRSEGLKKVLEQAAQEVYEGKIYIGGKSDVEGKALTSIPFAERAICSRQALPLNQCISEETKNRASENCGELAKLHYLKPPQYVFTLMKTRGQKETAWAAGVLLSALQETALRIDREIAENRLSIGTNSACQGAALDFFLITEKFKSAENLSSLQGCQDKGLVGCTVQKYFEAALEMMKASYLQIIRCVLFEEALRASRDYNRDFFARVVREVVDPCVQRCGEDPVCLPQCYSSRFSRWISDDLQAKFPLTYSACSGPASGGVR